MSIPLARENDRLRRTSSRESSLIVGCPGLLDSSDIHAVVQVYLFNPRPN